MVPVTIDIDISILVSNGGVIDLVVNNRIQQEVLVAIWIALSEHVLQYRVGGKLSSASIWELNLIHLCIKYGIDVGLAMEIPIDVSCAVPDSPFKSGPPDGKIHLSSNIGVGHLRGDLIGMGKPEWGILIILIKFECGGVSVNALGG